MVTTTHMTEQAQATIGRLLTAILSRSVTEELRNELAQLQDQHIPEPFDHLVKAVGGDARTGDELAEVALIELRGICNELLDPNYPS